MGAKYGDGHITDIAERAHAAGHRRSTPSEQRTRDRFLEKVYENALTLELRRCGIHVEQQYPLKVFYEGEVVGEYAADLLVDDRLILELKAAKALDPVHSAQCINYLRATGLKICLLINFGKPQAEIKRLVLNL